MLALAVSGGCCTRSPIEPAAFDAWQGVREDARLGVLARMDPAFMEKRRVDPISMEYASILLERIDLLDEAMKELR